MRPLRNMTYFICIDLFTAHGAFSFTGSDIKGKTIVPESELSNSYEDQSSYFFEKYSKDLLVEVKLHFCKVDPNPDVPDLVPKCVSLRDLKVDVRHVPWCSAGTFLCPRCCATGFLCVPENNQ